MSSRAGLNQWPSECLIVITPTAPDIILVDHFGNQTLLFFFFPIALWEILWPQFVVPRTIRSSQVFERHLLRVKRSESDPLNSIFIKSQWFYYEWKHLESLESRRGTRVYVLVSLPLSKVICCILHTSVLLFPSIPYLNARKCSL